MPGIPQETIEEIRDRNDIVAVVEQYVPLKRRGADYWGLCPFHKEKTPSFKVSPAHQAYYCFGCRKSGNVFHFIMDIESVDFVGAVRLLAQRVGVVIPEPQPLPRTGGQAPLPGGVRKEQVFQVLNDAARWFQQQLKGEVGAPARKYLEERGVPREYIERFGIGYAPDSWDALIQWASRRRYGRDLLLAAGLVKTANREGAPNASGRIYDLFRGRVMFPIHDELGRVVGFSGRVLSADAHGGKYVNTPETRVFTKGRLLYALHLARTSFRDHGGVLICEGQLDVISCHRAGLTHAVAPQGTAFTETHAALVRRFTDSVTFAFDADPAGRQAAVRSIYHALAAELKASVVQLPEGEDPDSILRGHGSEALVEVMSRPLDAFEFLYVIAVEEHDPGSVDGKATIARFVLEAVAKIPDPVLRSARCQWLSRRLDLPENAVLQELRRIVNRERRRSRFTRGGGRGAAGRVAAPPDPGVHSTESTPSALAAPDSREQHAREMLLDLALRHGPIAHQLAEKILPEYLDDTPVSRALELVLLETTEDRWETAAARLSADPELARDECVGRILAAPAFPELSRESGTVSALEAARARLTAALDDCLSVLEAARIDRAVEKLEQAMARKPDSREMRALLEEYQALIRQRDQLTRRRPAP